MSKKDKSPKPVVSDPLGVIPLLADNVEVKTDSSGMMQAKVTTPVTGLRKWLTEHFHYVYSRRFALDEYGTHYLSLVDGKRTLRQIVTDLTGKLNKDNIETEKAVLLFTKTMMIKGIVVLQVPPEAQKRN